MSEIEHENIRAEVLDTAKDLVLRNRSVDYGPPEEDFKRTAELWTAYLGPGYLFTAHDVAVMMMLVKVSRISESPSKLDHWVDIAGYAACGGEVRPRPVPFKEPDDE